MIRRAAAPVELTDWISCTAPPVRDGVYQCWYSAEMPDFEPEPFMVIYVRGRWLSAENNCGLPGLNNNPYNFSYRGQRRHVLVRRNDPLISALLDRPVDVYLIDARPRSAKFGGLASARPFKSEKSAQRFADRFSQLGLVVELP